MRWLLCVFILDPDLGPKTIPVKTKHGLCGLAVICAVCEEVFASLWSVQWPNYSAAIMKYYHAITQRCSTHSSREQRKCRMMCAFCLFLFVCLCVCVCEHEWAAHTRVGQTWWIMERRQSHQYCNDGTNTQPIGTSRHVNGRCIFN